MLRFFGILFATMFFPFVAKAQSEKVVYAYIARYQHIAKEHERLYHIPASITMAQGILESNAGQSRLAQNANNHFGIKVGSKWKGKPYRAKDDEPGLSKFRTYPSAEASYEDHASVLRNPHGNFYPQCFQYDVTNYRAWAYMLKKCGYATAPDYAESLIWFIETYKLYELSDGGYRMPQGQISRVARTTKITYKIVKREVVVYDTITVESTPEEIQNNETFVETQMEKEEPSFWRGPRNGLGCTILYPGQTLSDIAAKYEIPIMKIMEFNEVNGEDQIKTGDIIFLQKKKNKYTGAQDFYYVREGENLHDVAQTFGIRTAKLAKINHITTVTALMPGDKLRLK